MSAPRDLTELEAQVRSFRDERDWAQFHNPKDLAISIALEAAELLEHFQWKDGAEIAERLRNPGELRAVSHEMADVLLLLLSLSDRLEVDLFAAAQEKLALNAAKYPADASRGHATKYDRL